MTFINPTRGPLVTSGLGVFALAGFLVLAPSAAPVGAEEVPEYARAFHGGDYEGARALAANRLKDHPNDVQARLLLGRAEAAMGRFDAAYAEFSKALRLAPDDPDVLYYVGMTAGALAQQEFGRLLAEAPDSGRAHQLQGDSLEAQGKKKEAKAEYEAALEADPASAEVLVALGDLARSDFAVSKANVTEARDYYTRALRLAPRDYGALYGLGVSEATAGEHAKAVESLRGAVEEEPDSPTAHLALGISLLETGEVSAAVVELETAARLEPRLRQAYFHLARAYNTLGRPEDMERAVARFRELAREEQEANAALIGAPNPSE
jgi:tetratricopeptide (TPR) repeat protein